MNAEPELNRTERRRIEFKNRIKMAALTLFEDQGITNTSVASIIKEADIAHKTFFNHFPSKDHLLEFLVSETMRVAFAGFDETEELALSPKEKLERSYLSIAKAMESMDGGVKEVVSYYFIGTEGPKHIRQEHTSRFHDYVVGILTEAKKQGSLNEDFSVNVLAEITVGMYSSFIMNWVGTDDYPLTKKMKQVIKFIHSSVFKP